MAFKLMIEAMVYPLIYGGFISILMKKQGAAMQLYNYPPQIQARAVKRGITTEKEMTENARKNKTIGFAVMTILNLILICGVNHERTFWAGFYQSYILLNAFSLSDAAVIDSVWFCHSKFWIIPGTEDMTEAYHDYWFHWKWFFFGLVMVLPMAVIIGGFTAIIGLIVN